MATSLTYSKGVNMKKNKKLWVNCSPQEKHEVKEIEREKGWLDFLYLKKQITKRKWMAEKKKLIKKLDKVEKKYGL